MEKRIISWILAVCMILAMFPMQVHGAEGNTVYLNAEAYWPSSQYDYAVWAWPTNGDGYWVLPQGSADSSGWVTFQVDESNLLFVALHKGTATDWSNMAYQTGDLVVDGANVCFTLTSIDTGDWSSVSSCAHSWDGGVVTTPASCTAEGVMTFTCTLCGNSYTQKIAKTEHTLNNSGVCTLCGTVPGMVFASYIHLFPEAEYDCYAWIWPEGGSGRWVAPSSTQAVDGYTAFPVESTDTYVIFLIVPEGAQASWSNRVTQTYDITIEGVTYETLHGPYTPSTLGAENRMDTYSAEEPCAHTWLESSTPANCTTEGKRILDCGNCGASVNVAVPATGHSAVPDTLTVITPATCTSDGSSTYTCQNCQQEVTVTIPATGHSYDADGTCSCGYTPAVQCTYKGTVTYFDSLRSAYRSSNIGTYYLKLLKDCTALDQELMIYDHSPLELDLNGHTLSVCGGSYGAILLSGGDATVKNGTVEIQNGNVNGFVVQAAKLTLTDVTFVPAEGANVAAGSACVYNATGSCELNNVKLQGQVSYFLHHSSADGTAVLNNCNTYDANLPEAANIILTRSGASLTLNGGRYQYLYITDGWNSALPEGSCYRYIDGGNYVGTATAGTELYGVEVVSVPLIPTVAETITAILGSPLTLEPSYTANIQDFDPAALTTYWQYESGFFEATQDGQGLIPIATGETEISCVYNYKGYQVIATVAVTVTPCIEHSYDSQGLCTYCGDYEPAEDTNADGYLEIANPGNLWWFTQQVNGGNKSLNAELTADIDLSGTCGEGIGSWEPIGSDKHYQGHFDGQGYTISNLYVNTTGNKVGLFGHVYRGGTVENLGVTGQVTNGIYTGGIVGRLDGATIRNCWANVSVQAGRYGGGIFGRAVEASQIENCRNLGTITLIEEVTEYSDLCLGGIGGSVAVSESSIRNCVNLGNITLPMFVITDIGGIVGCTYCTIENCFNIGSFTQTDGFEEPIAGDMIGTATLNNCYYLSDTTTEDGGRTAEQFASGQVAYELNGKVTNQDSVWKQTIGTDDYPVFSGELVYYGTPHSCDGTALEPIYSNTPVDESVPPHSYENNLCTVCAHSNDVPAFGNNGWEISNAAQLWWFAQRVNSGVSTNNAVLVADIDMSTTCGENLRSWEPIGGFEGTFDGQGHTISNLYVDSQEAHVGLFSETSNATIRNLGLTGTVSGFFTYVNTGTSSIEGAVGGIVGYAYGGAIENCWTNMTVTGGHHVGGICGKLVAGCIQGCTSQGTVTRQDQGDNVDCAAGGIVGRTLQASILACSNLAQVTDAGYTFAGGIVGYQDGKTPIQNCRNLGTITGGSTSGLGGIVGYQNGDIQSCYNVGTISDQSDYADPISGRVSSGETYRCYYLSENGVTAEDFASGRVAYALNGKVTNQDSVWKQTIGTDPYPVLSGPLVYGGIPYRCDGTALEPIYSNTPVDESVPPHSYDQGGICTVCDQSSTPALDSDGDGYYEIDTPAKLWWFAQQVNSGNSAINAVLTADIDLSLICGENLRNWDPIGSSYNFAGHFDGQSHTISNLYYVGDGENVGLFGMVENATIENLGVTGTITNWSDYGYTGGICGFAYSITLRNCWTDMAVSGKNFVGGICGDMGSGLIEGCTSRGSVAGLDSREYIGGIAGMQSEGTIENCINYSSITGMDYAVIGGIISYGYGVIQNCANQGTVSGIGEAYAGGIVGSHYGTMKNSYNVGTVTSESTNVGPLYGTMRENIPAPVSCYYLSDTETTDGGRTAAQFASGQVAYELNGSTTADTSTWRQTLGTDTYPQLSGSLVYAGTPHSCDGTALEMIYSNAPVDESNQPHSYENGFCTACGGYEEPQLVDGVYQIANGGNLFWFAQTVNGGESAANAQLTADIDLENREWTPINGYTGTFDGAGHSITGLFVSEIPASTGYKMGFFGTILSPAVVKNFTISGKVQADNGYPNAVGGVVGASGENDKANGGTVSGITSRVTLSTTAGKVVTHLGGVVGAMYGGTVSQCLFDGTVYYNGGTITEMGGIVGYGQAGTIQSCINLANISRATHAGGILGYVNNANTHVINCCNYGKISGGTNYTGAIIGRANSSCGTVEGNYYCSDNMTDAFGTGSGVAFGEAAAIAKTEEAFRSGEVTWLLNGGSSEGIWKQSSDGLPGFAGQTVYLQNIYNCAGTVVGQIYTNTPGDGTIPDHTLDDNGLCTACGFQCEALVTIGGQTWGFATLQEALTKAQEGTAENRALVKVCVDLNMDIDWINPPMLTPTMNGGYAILDLNGHAFGFYSSYGLKLTGTNLIIRDSSQAQTGQLYNWNGYGVYADRDSYVELQSGTVGSYLNKGGIYLGNGSEGLQTDGKLLGQVRAVESRYTMQGGEILSSGQGVFATESTIVIQDGTITAGTWLFTAYDCENLTITGGTFATSNGINVIDLGISVDVSKISIQGGTFQGGVKTQVDYDGSVSLASLLAQGYAFRAEDGSFVNLTADQSEVAQTVTVAQAPMYITKQPQDVTMQTTDAVRLFIGVQASASSNTNYYEWFREGEAEAVGTKNVLELVAPEAGTYPILLRRDPCGHRLPGGEPDCHRHRYGVQPQPGRQCLLYPLRQADGGQPDGGRPDHLLSPGLGGPPQGQRNHRCYCDPADGHRL